MFVIRSSGVVGGGLRGLRFVTGTKKRGGYRGKRAVLVGDQGGEGNAKVIEIPKFSELMRKIYKRCHPDLVRSRFPEAASSNEVGLQTINSVLDTIKKFNSFPPQIIQTIPLALLPEDGDELRHVTLRIKTAGGDCRKSLTQSFTDLFLQAGLLKENISSMEEGSGLPKAKKRGKKSKLKEAPVLFEWNDGYFLTKDEEEEGGAVINV